MYNIAIFPLMRQNFEGAFIGINRLKKRQQLRMAVFQSVVRFEEVMYLLQDNPNVIIKDQNPIIRQSYLSQVWRFGRASAL